MGYDLNKAPMPQEATLAQRVESLSKRNSKLQRESIDLRTKLAAETKRADDAEAQRDKLVELLRECFHDGLESYWLRDRVEDALAEMEGNK